MHAHAIKKRLSYRREGRPRNQAISNATSQTVVQSEGDMSCELVESAPCLVLDSREVARKLWHMMPGMLILPVPLLQNFPLVANHLPALIVVSTAILGVLSMVHARRFTRPGERDWSVSVWAFAATALLPLIVFPDREELALMAIAILAFGDGAAALGGMALRGPALPWNAKKTVTGTLSFILCAAPCAAWICWGVSSPQVPFQTALLSAIVAAAVAAVAESIPSSINDNIRVGAVTTAMLFVLQGTILGA